MAQRSKTGRTKRKSFKPRIWTKDEIRQLRVLASQRLSAAVIARRLKRSLDSTKKKASNLGMPLGVAVRWTDGELRRQSWSRKSEQGDKWSFCLTAGTLCPANQEKP
jgi:hypothetical protein